ncbi:hypothetical protein [Methyloglobulus sp.]|uniref:hypothetical protein n=1 Tax=Methyloglobulus sp. TaxID=2518622 RepID=UPI003988F08E
MKRENITFLIVIISALPEILLGGDKGPINPVHKYWSCAITSYNSLVEGKYQEGRCRANTEYSELPCREFFVEFEGADGIRPGVPFKQTIGHNMQKSPSTSDDEFNTPTQSTTTTIEINKDKDQYLYTHTIEKTGANFADKWLYRGKCSYYEASANEKIYMEKGLDAAQ